MIPSYGSSFRANAERMFSIEWCTGHKDKTGNEMVEKEAKVGAELWSQDHNTDKCQKESKRESCG